MTITTITITAETNAGDLRAEIGQNYGAILDLKHNREYGDHTVELLRDVNPDDVNDYAEVMYFQAAHRAAIDNNGGTHWTDASSAVDALRRYREDGLMEETMAATQKDHDSAMRLLGWAKRGEIELSETDKRALSSLAGNWAASLPVDAGHLYRLHDLVRRFGDHQPRLEMIATDPARRHHRYLTPSTAWSIEARSGEIVATFSAPEAGNEVLTGPADLIGQTFKTRDEAFAAVASRI